METPTSKEALARTMTEERARWEALLAEVGTERMERPGVTGEWSVKDIIAHLMAWESRPVEWLRAARTGTRPAAPAWDAGLAEEQVNAWIQQHYRTHALQDIVSQSRQNFDALVRAIETMPEEDLVTRGRFEWLKGNSLLESLGGNTFEHYREHGDAIRAWLANPGER